jgi:hypothetical protein
VALPVLSCCGSDMSYGLVSVESTLLSLLLVSKVFERSEAILLFGISVDVLVDGSSSSEWTLVVVDVTSGCGGLITVTEVVIFGALFTVMMSSKGEAVLAALDPESVETSVTGRGID